MGALAARLRRRTSDSKLIRTQECPRGRLQERTPGTPPLLNSPQRRKGGEDGEMGGQRADDAAPRSTAFRRAPLLRTRLFTSRVGRTAKWSLTNLRH